MGHTGSTRADIWSEVLKLQRGRGRLPGMTSSHAITYAS